MPLAEWWLDRMLQLTYASERGAAIAYNGHARAVASDEDRAVVAQIEKDEWHHRERLLTVMQGRGVRRLGWLDWVFFFVGTTVSFGCQFWPEWASALGASWFEVNGVSEYRRLASLARWAGQDDLVPLFDEMADQEQVHRDIFWGLAWERSPLGGDRESTG